MEKTTGSHFMFDDMAEDTTKICVAGVGGGGGNAVNNMITQGLHGVHFVAIDTDTQALNSNLANNKIQAGRSLTKGLGTGACPAVGAEAMSEDQKEIGQVLQDFDMVFVTAGMGGGTGTGGAPVVAEIARQLGILTVATVTKPFACEGKRRMDMAIGGTNCIRQHVDALIVIPNERLLNVADDAMSLVEAFQLADNVLYNATRGISDLITMNSLIGIDFVDVRTIMQEKGTALIGSATASGKNRAETAAIEAISSPLLDGLSIGGARNILVNITAGKSLGIREATTATNIIKQEAGDKVEVIFGAVVNEEMGDDLRVTVIATGLGQSGFRSSGYLRHRRRDIGELERRSAPLFAARNHGSTPLGSGASPLLTGAATNGDGGGLSSHEMSLVHRIAGRMRGWFDEI